MSTSPRISTRKADGRGAAAPSELDIELAEHDELLALVRDVAVKMNETSSAEEALAFSLRRLCEYGGWQAGFAYRCDRERGSLTPAAGFHGRRALQPLHDAIMGRELPVHDGLARRLEADLAALATGDLEQSVSGQRLLCEQLGLAQVSVVAVRAARDAEAPELVLEFYGEGRSGLPEGVGIAMESVVAQLGHLLRRERAHRLLEEQSRQVRHILEAAADGILTVSADGAIEDLNAAAQQMLGARASLRGRHVTDLLPGLERVLPMHSALTALRASGGLELEATDAKGETIPVHVTMSETLPGERSRYILAMRDFRAIRLAQQRTVQQERLAAMGEMMTALAHESRNALQRLQSCLTLLELRGNAEVQGLVGDMQDAQDHLKRLYEEVRSYAAPLQLDVGSTDVGLLAEQVWWQLRPSWQPKRLECRIVGKTDRREVLADERKVGQVLRNVLENAIEASRDGGAVAVEIADDTLEDAPAVRVEVRDEGGGMTPEVRRRAFDLLYTTKRSGTGMGLAISRRIVQEHSGEITLRSAPDEGTTVLIRLPLGLAASAKGTDPA